MAKQLRKANRQGRSFWMLQPEGNRAGWQANARNAWKFVQWGISDFMLTGLALLSLHYIVYPIIKSFFTRDLSGHTPSQVMIETALLWAFVPLVVLMASLLHYRLESRDLRDLKRLINEQKEKPPLARNAT